jgi:hypothetical protein
MPCKTRVQLDFAPSALDILDRLQVQTNASSRAEVIRNALGIMQWVVGHVLKGNEIKVHRKKGSVIEECAVEFPFLLIDKP